MSNKQLRTVIRTVHIIAGLAIVALIYIEPARTSVAYQTFVQLLTIPVIIISGIAMWQQATLSRLRREPKLKA
jgi:hypothetical protein